MRTVTSRSAASPNSQDELDHPSAAKHRYCDYHFYFSFRACALPLDYLGRNIRAESNQDVNAPGFSQILSDAMALFRSHAQR